jgi:peroxiredoxin
MAQFESRKSELENSGAQLAFIAAEKRDGMFKPENYLREHPVSFPFLLDEARRTVKAYGVHQTFGFDGLNIARPATFIVGPDAILRFVHRGANQLDRTPVDEILGGVRAA